MQQLKYYLLKRISLFYLKRHLFIYNLVLFSLFFVPPALCKHFFFFYFRFCIIVKNISLNAKMLLDMKRGNVSISVPVKHFCCNKGFSCDFDILRVRERVNSTCGSGSAFASREREITTPSDFS